jgi:putative addiction module killer protein
MKIIRTQEFIDNVKSVNDAKLSAIITSRLDRIANGNLGDTKSVGDGISELRIHYGAGYRIYYVMRGKKIIILLCAGSKSDQKKNIERAKELAKGI